MYTLADQQPGAFAEGPAIVEGPFFTARVLAGWTFEVIRRRRPPPHRPPLNRPSNPRKRLTPCEFR